MSPPAGCLVGSGIGPLESGSRGSSSGSPPARAAKNLSRAPTPRLHRCSKASIEKMVPHQPAIPRNAPTAGQSQSTLSQPSGPSGPPRPAQIAQNTGQDSVRTQDKPYSLTLTALLLACLPCSFNRPVLAPIIAQDKSRSTSHSGPRQGVLFQASL
ncbi:Uncharacterised protein [Bordetella pertussis]|nr:Uncharacterised protein [Bordetella pertussis]CFW40855.1 Uncharacterised protein [Bordetella pertussis]